MPEKLTPEEFDWVISTLQHSHLASLYQVAIVKMFDMKDSISTVLENTGEKAE